MRIGTILIIVVLALLLFGAKRLPDLARSLGKSARILKAETKALKDGTVAAAKDLKDETVAAAKEGAAEPIEAPRVIKSAPGQNARVEDRG
ncbi:Sec-independent protein translocase subunit TatA [Kitasatospora sp. NPDC002040]|uniref:Sec-independent protein translocase subunit TatA n=1 Tax=Kitasatospora sp. NPDC002040 TaxID=3154661 RepID=UPI00331DB565